MLYQYLQTQLIKENLVYDLISFFPYFFFFQCLLLFFSISIYLKMALVEYSYYLQFNNNKYLHFWVYNDIYNENNIL